VSTKGDETMKNFKKKSLSLRKVKRETKKFIELGKAPLLSATITLTDGARIETTSAAVKLLADALGENKAADWHGKYMNKFDELLKQAYTELEDIIKEVKSERE